MFKWARRHKNGYEVSSKGDKRFSALNAILSDGRSIEQHYQCDIKGYDIGGTNWRLGKGKPSLRECDLLKEYINLWREWAQDNLHLMRELYKEAIKHDCKCGSSERTLRVRDLSEPNEPCILTDCFATTEVNQAHALSIVLNELVKKGKQ